MPTEKAWPRLQRKGSRPVTPASGNSSAALVGCSAGHSCVSSSWRRVLSDSPRVGSWLCAPVAATPGSAARCLAGARGFLYRLWPAAPLPGGVRRGPLGRPTGMSPYLAAGHPASPGRPARAPQAPGAAAGLPKEGAPGRGPGNTARPYKECLPAGTSPDPRATRPPSAPAARPGKEKEKPPAAGSRHKGRGQGRGVWGVTLPPSPPLAGRPRQKRQEGSRWGQRAGGRGGDPAALGPAFRGGHCSPGPLGNPRLGLDGLLPEPLALPQKGFPLLSRGITST